METSLQEHAGACHWRISPAINSRQAPYQLTLIYSFSDPDSAGETAVCDKPNNIPAARKRTRRRTYRKITAADIAPFESNASSRALLRSAAGAILPALYTRTPTLNREGDITNQGETFLPADASTIIESATALLAHQLRRGAKILRDPSLLLRFLQLRLVSQPRPVFAVFFLDRHRRLIRFAEIFHGQDSEISMHPREVVREALGCNAEQLLCVRSDPQGDHQPTLTDVENARRLMRAMSLLQLPILDYVVVGKSVTSLRASGHLLN
jgi:DNA repair protein RadC